MEESDNQKERRNSHRGLVVVLIVLMVAIVGLGVGVAVVRNNTAEGDDTSLDGDDVESSNNDAECYYNVKDSVECENYVSSLEEKVGKGGNDDEYVKNVLSLAFLYSEDDVDKAIELLNKTLQAEITDQERYNVLVALLSFYRQKKDVAGEIGILEQLVALPDDMELEYEDWREVKKDLVSELNERRLEKNG